MLASHILPRLEDFGRKPKYVIDLFRERLQGRVAEFSQCPTSHKFCPTKELREMIDANLFGRELDEKEIRSYSQTLRSLARKFGFTIISNKDSHLTEESLKIRDYFSNLLKESGRVPSQHKIFPTALAEELSDMYSLIILPKTVRSIARELGFQVADLSESQIRSQETEDLKKLREYLRGFKLVLIERDIDPGNCLFFEADLQRELETDLYNWTAIETIRKEGFITANVSEVLTHRQETEDLSKLRKHLDDKEKELKCINLTPSQYIIFPAELRDELKLSCSLNTIRRNTEKKGFKAPGNREAQIKDKQTNESRIIRRCILSKRLELITQGIYSASCLLYPSELARSLGLDTKYKVTIASTATSEGFKLASLTKSARMRRKPPGEKIIWEVLDTPDKIQDYYILRFPDEVKRIREYLLNLRLNLRFPDNYKVDSVGLTA